MECVYFAIGAVLIFLFFWGLSKIIDHLYDRREQKRKEEYPELHNLFILRDKAISLRGACRANELEVYKKEIDKITAEMVYYPDYIQGQMKIRLEILREKYLVADNEYKRLDKQAETYQNQIQEYAIKYNLEWAL